MLALVILLYCQPNTPTIEAACFEWMHDCIVETAPLQGLEAAEEICIETLPIHLWPEGGL